MSDLQRSFAKAKLAGLPFEPPLPPSALQEQYDEDEENDDLKPLPGSTPDDDSSSASSASSASSSGTIRPSPSKHLFARPKGFVESLLNYACSSTVIMMYLTVFLKGQNAVDHSSLYRIIIIESVDVNSQSPLTLSNHPVPQPEEKP